MSMNEHSGAVPQWTASDRLAKARKVADLSQTQLAERLGISERTIKRYEAGATPKRGIVLGWAMATGVNATWLEHGIDVNGNDPDDGTNQAATRDSPEFGCNVYPLLVAA